MSDEKQFVPFPMTANGMATPATAEELLLAESSGYSHPNLLRDIDPSAVPEDTTPPVIGVFNNQSIVMSTRRIHNDENNDEEIP